MKYIFLIITLLFTTQTSARIKHLSYEEHVKQAQDLRKEQNRIIDEIFAEADNVFLAFVLLKKSTTKTMGDEQYYVHKYEFKKIKNIKGINPHQEYTFKDPENREIIIISGGPKIELNNKYLSHERYFIIYMKGNDLLRAAEYIDYDGLINSKEEMALIKKVNK